MKLLDLLFVAFTLSGVSSAIPTAETKTLEPITGTIVSRGVTENGEPYTITSDFVDLTDADLALFENYPGNTTSVVEKRWGPGASGNCNQWYSAKYCYCGGAIGNRGDSYWGSQDFCKKILFQKFRNGSLHHIKWLPTVKIEYWVTNSCNEDRSVGNNCGDIFLDLIDWCEWEYLTAKGGHHKYNDCLQFSIVGVQGLGSHPFFTWVKKVQAPESKPRRKFVDKLWTKKDKKAPEQEGQSGPEEFMWPRDLLVPLFTNARVATYSYKSGKGVKTTLRQLAEQFLNILSQHRQKPDERRRPLVLIGHSLGGLVIQQALVIAALNRDFQDLRLSVSGIIFLGAPFQGSSAAVLGKRLAQAVGDDPSLLELLQKDNPNLHSLSKDFCDSHHEWDFVCFYEDTDADYSLIKTRVVTASSATLSGRRMIFLHTDHSGLNKFSGANDENYALVLPEIQRMVDNGPLMVTNRFKTKEDEATRNKHWLVPRGVNRLFTGRSEIIDRIREALQDDDAQHSEKLKVFVITGLGGMGKTEICLQVANMLREEFWGVFWIDADSESTAKNDFISAVAAFGSSAESIDDALRLLANTKHRWLLILDNADDPEFNYQAYLPSGSRGVVVVTSRIYDCCQYSTVGSEVLTSLDIGLSKQLLLRAANIAEELWPSVDQQAEDIAKLIGSHTLALIQAGTYVAKGYSRLDQYPEVYSKHRKRLLTYRPSQARSRYGDVYATFEASAHVLECSESEDAKDALCLLGILSVLHSSALPLQMFENAWKRSKKVIDVSDTGTDLSSLCRWHALQLPELMAVEANEWDPYRLNKAIYLLVSLSFLVRNNPAGEPPTLSMHPLAHAWAKDRQELAQQGQTWMSTACIFALSFTTDEYSSHRDHLLHWQSLLSIGVKTAFSLGPKPMVISIFLTCGRSLVLHREDSKLGTLLHDIFGTLGIKLDTPSIEYLGIYKAYAISLSLLGDISGSLQLQIQIAKIQDKILPSSHYKRLISQHELGRAYRESGEVEMAIEILEQVVEAQESLPVTSSRRLASQGELVRAYNANGQADKAITLMEQVVRVRDDILPVTDPARLTSQYELASAYLNGGQVEKSIEIFEHVVKIEEDAIAYNSPCAACTSARARTRISERWASGKVNRDLGARSEDSRRCVANNSPCAACISARARTRISYGWASGEGDRTLGACC
ncbi:hypothetical protein V498_09778 [Pseudogymnoascus sp. VKM F-4517 (FW-2822)]|nr:hypothetical protein V498_09778 [Pseudogymnoascus sp. VKM F-4517 (FW-2822)]